MSDKDDLIRVLDATSTPYRHMGFGPFREDYLTQEAFEKARCPSIEYLIPTAVEPVVSLEEASFDEN